MPEYKFITGETFSVMANDAIHAREIINTYFDGEDPDGSYVTEEDIDSVTYVENETLLLDD